MIKPFIHKGDNRLPNVSFDNTTGILEFSGRSIPDNALGFFKPLYEWLEEYKQNPCKETIANIKFDYFNTSSSKCLFDIFKSLTNLHDAGHSVVVNWYFYEDDDQEEVGEDYKSILKLPFNLIQVSR